MTTKYDNLTSASFCTPIIVVDGNDISFFNNIDDMLCYLEIIDVKNQVYNVYDSEGLELKLIVEEKEQKLFYGFVKNKREHLKLIKPSTDSNKSENLKRKLINFLLIHNKQQKESDLELMRLKQVVNICVESIGYTR